MYVVHCALKAKKRILLFCYVDLEEDFVPLYKRNAMYYKLQKEYEFLVNKTQISLRRGTK